MRQLHFGMSIRKERLMVFRALAFWYIHRGKTELEDVQVNLVSGKTIDLDMIRYYPSINTEEDL